MDKDYASFGEFEAIDYGTFALVFFRGREFDTFECYPDQKFQTSFEIWLDEQPKFMLDS